MFNRDLFSYDPQTHTGTYEGKPIPSVTQLVDILYPMDSDIPQERIDNAAKHGTLVHEAIEQLNEYFDNPFDFSHNMSVIVEVASKVANFKNLPELLDYVGVLSAYKLKPFDYEELIFLLDENGDLICYGHYDFTAMAQEDNVLFMEDRLYLFDVKTTSLFNRKKVAFQESIYALAYEQNSKNYITNIFGLWLENGAKIIPLVRMDNGYLIKLCKQLMEVWNKRRLENE